MAATEFTAGIDEDWNDAGNWDNGVPGAGDDATVPAAKTCEVDLNDTATAINTITIGGLLYHQTNIDTALRAVKWTVQNGGEHRLGTDGAAIDDSHVAQCIMDVASDGAEGYQINNGSKVTTEGTPTYSLASESWANCRDTTASESASGQKDIQVTNAAKIANLASGMTILLKGTTSYNQDEEMIVDSIAGDTITCTVNLTNTHAAGAGIAILSRNVVFRSADPAKRALIDNDNTVAGNVSLKLTELRDIYAVAGNQNETRTQVLHYCSLRNTRSGIQYASDVGQSVFSGSTSKSINSSQASGFDECIFGGNVSQGVYNDASSTFTDCEFWGIQYLFVGGFGRLRISGCSCGAATQVFRSGYFNGTITNCDFSAADALAYSAGIRFVARNTKLPSTLWAVVSSYRRGQVYSQDHNQVLGAAMSSIDGIGTIERQNSVARSGHAAELTPDTQCSSDEPLEIEWDIPCTHGDVLAISVYVRVNSTYGTANDPTLILDPDSIYGCNDTSSENVTAHDTWTKLTATGTVDLGGAGKKGTVNVVLRVPYYVSGGKVYVDDFDVGVA